MKFVSLLSISALTSSILIATPQAKAAVVFLDLNTFTPGGPGTGTFAGTLGGVNVTGSILAGGSSNFQILGINPTDWAGTTIDNTTPQYSYSNIYTPSQNLGDRVGYGMFAGASSQSATLTIQFSSPVTNPTFHVANLDGMIYDFSDPSNGSIALSLLSGNGGGGDGLTVDTTNKIIADANPFTGVGLSPFTPPPTTGTRSAYGSVELLGTFSTLNIKLQGNPSLTVAGDGGSFMISTTVPEPSTVLSLLTLGTLGAASTLKRKLKP
ncbi:PEP-CTERM sorting domain-containing protein [Microcystis aeruginosa NIES-298]|uniref:Ice-binding protein C-terminal domain-containing protein n=2 Tax=Microcystis TaxID=1125 RepID=A0A2H6BQP4_MICAE|nr:MULTISPECIES: PEP-CTERM sorting domain-containing protein [Microcystis]MBD2599538.1 PEP-CTERM sorting domain-containing protein [Microcystis viridis FACHB-1342]MCA2622452.1 PEP-CTERM sorting domain-containing protein [Microcystis sp. M19BS1]MCA2631416.1 PEP-CTERM sorting domain-containing protein [Microcystis sp. M20BS1]MDB9386099.1 PEP-CTERM sorting domain-containing protein [Microcystis aeruginosa CS-583]MDB9542881.1 PEP-CTERM sorting domain-containing protein [Microcystis aeruginosa CS-1